MVSIQYLTYFMKVCQTRSMNKAAEELFISQPALSLAMKNLEKELNVTLFTRSNKGIELTMEGEKLLRHTRLIMGQFALLENLGAAEEYRQLSVSAFPCLIPANVLIEYKCEEKFKNSHIDYQECRVGQIIENVADSISEIGIIQYNNHQISALNKRLKSRNLELCDICQNRWAVAVGEKSPLYEKKTVSLDELKQFRVIRLRDDYFSHLTSEIQGDEISPGDLDCDWINSGVMISALLENTDSFMFMTEQRHFMNLSSRLHLIPVDNPKVDIHVAWIKKKNMLLTDEAVFFIDLVSREFAIK